MINTSKKQVIVGIYKITSPTGRIYIGQSNNIVDRWRGYKHINNVKKQPKLYRSFLKHSVETHIFEIIEECEESKLKELEIWWKCYYGHKCVENGLNHNYWDQTPILKGSKLSKETCEKKSKAMIGKFHTESTKQKIKLSRKCKIVNQYDLQGNFIKEWPSTLEIERQLKIANQSISQCCNGKLKTCGKLIWKYKQ